MTIHQFYIVELSIDIIFIGYNMPHHPLIKNDKYVTNTSTFYDAFSKQTDCLLLNDCLLPGLRLNPNFLDMILKFCEYGIAFSADTEKVFLQIAIAEEDCNYL